MEFCFHRTLILLLSYIHLFCYYCKGLQLNISLAIIDEIVNLTFEYLQMLQNKTVSVFETTIRVLGGLLSAHLIASDYATVVISCVPLCFKLSHL